MGAPKPLLMTGPSGPTFVRRLAASLIEGGAADALVVGRMGDEGLIAEVRACAELGMCARFVPNPHADRGQLSSVIAGLNAADRPGVAAVLVTPVDAPLIRSETVRTLIAAFTSSGAPIVRATYRGRHGHPVIFGRAVFAELRAADPTIGAKATVRAHARDLLDVDVDDPGVTQDIDDPADYGALFLNAPR
jgi:CTP:molybdopterin cytidylyltransferase MocA